MRIVRRLLPVPLQYANLYDMAQAEAYLSHMALKGYFIKKVGLTLLLKKVHLKKSNIA